MHPPLHRPHPECEDAVKRLLECHTDNPVAKFFGACNDAKRDLDRCFKAEKEKKRAENARVARERRAKFEELRASSSSSASSASASSAESA